MQNETAVTPTVPINITNETGAGRAPESPAAVTSQSDIMAETTLSSLLTSSPEEPAISSNTTAEHSPTQASSTTPDSLSNLSHHCKCGSVCFHAQEEPYLSFFKTSWLLLIGLTSLQSVSEDSSMNGFWQLMLITWKYLLCGLE